ncbi:hypothetical protein B566_EDAN006605 [Ephemera danica]|nr:hypothetical protein B566_EDAN006605 [Ephemera danica]
MEVKKRKVDEKATQLHAIASLKVLLDATKPQNGAAAMANHAGHSSSQQQSGLEAGTAAQQAAAMANRSQETELAGTGGADQPNGVLGQEEGADPVSTIQPF